MASAVIGALRINFSADTAEFRRNMTQAEKMAEKFGRSIGSSIRRSVLSFGAAAAAAAGPAALGLLVKSSIETISAQVDLAKRVGASVSAIQTLQETAKLAGASQEALSSTIGKLNQRLGEAARTGSGPTYEALKRLGLTAEELSAMDADVRIKALADRMSELGFTTQQQADTLKQFGVRNQEIINLFIEGSGAIERTRNELTQLGVILSDVDAQKVEEAGDSLDKLWQISQGLGNQLAVQLAPSIIEFVEGMTNWAKEGNKAKTIIDALRSAWNSLNAEWITGTALIETVTRRWQLAQEVIASFRFGQKGGVDWNAFRQAHEKAASDITQIWVNRDAQLAELKGPGVLLSGLEAHLNRINPLVQGVDAAIARIQKNTFGDDGGDNEAEKKEKEKRAKELADYQEHLASRLVTLQESLMTERETEIAEYEQRLLALEDFHSRGMLSDQEYRDALVRNSEQHAERLMDIDDDIARNNERNAKKQMDTYFDIADNIQSALSSLFGDSKAWAIAEAIINTATAITKALAVYGPTPQGFAAAAAAAAAGAAQLAAIRKQSSRGGGGGSPRVSKSSASEGRDSDRQQQSTQAAGGQTLFIRGLDPSQLYSGEAVRELAKRLIEYQRDGGKVVLAKA